jgi:hypothetical protein
MLNEKTCPQLKFVSTLHRKLRKAGKLKDSFFIGCKLPDHRSSAIELMKQLSLR